MEHGPVEEDEARGGGRLLPFEVAVAAAQPSEEESEPS